MRPGVEAQPAARASLAAGPSDVNPFATRFIRPGAATYLFGDGESPAQLVEQLQQQGWRGQVVGPHGSGKSTLLATLWPLLTAAGREIVFCQLREGDRRLPFTSAQRGAWNERTLVLVDGYEQLSVWGRWRLHGWVRARGSGLLITSHAPAGLPDLWRAEASLGLAQRVAARLQAGQLPLVTSEDVARAWARQGPNLRETLLELYDVYERQRRATEAGASGPK